MTDKPLTIEQFVLQSGFTPPTDRTVPDPHIVELIHLPTPTRRSRDMKYQQEASEAYRERVKSVKEALHENGGTIQKWMYNTLYPEELRQIWTSGEWIRLDHPTGKE